MKTAESKTTSSAASTAAKTQNAPFFSKEAQGESAFFGGETAEAELFFSPRTLQPKLTIGKPNDKYEQQADAVADQVVAKLNSPTPSPPTPKGSTIAAQTSNGRNTQTAINNKQSAISNPSTPSVQAKCDHCEQEEKLQKKDEEIGHVGEQVQMKPIFDSAAEPPPDDNVQRKTDGNTEGEASSDFSSQLSSSKGGGTSLPADTQEKMGSTIGADFSGVRIHTGSEAAKMSNDIGAQAFTHGNNVYFNEGKYNPSSTEGSHLLAHELTHTVQQGAAVKRKPDLINPAVHAMHITDIQREKADIAKGGTSDIQRSPIDWIKNQIKSGLNWAAERLIPGYSLLNVILGKNLITDEAVERSGVNIVKAYMRLVPVVGSILLAELEETETLTQAGAWTEEQVAAFGINFDDIAKRLTSMWDEMSVWNGVDENVAIFRRYIGPVLGKFMAFSSVMQQKMKELRLEGALRLVGAHELLKAIKESPAAFKRVVDNPKEILNNFMEALKRGFSSFKDNFATHFKNALFGWLLGKAASMGVQMPKEFSVAGVFHLVAQLAGLTYGAIKALVIDKLGPKYGKKAAKVFAAIEKGVAVVQRVITEGPMALWEMLKEQLTNLKDMVISQITQLVTTEIIKSAVTKLLSMLNPAGALVQLIMTLYRVIKFFVDNWSTIAEIASGIISTVTQVALGALGGAAGFIEKVLAKGMQMIISFLARIFGLGGIADKVKDLLKKLGGVLIKARDWAVNWLVEKGKELYEKVFGKKEDGKDDKKKGGLGAVEDKIKNEGKEKGKDGEVKKEDADQIVADVKSQESNVIKDISVKEIGESWEFKYIQKQEDKVIIAKKTVGKGKELVGKIAPNEAPEGYNYYDFKDGAFKIRRQPNKEKEGYIKLTIESTKIPGDTDNFGVENKIIESEEEGGNNRIATPGALTKAIGGARANHQAHHIIPDAEVQKIKSRNTLLSYNLDRGQNGIMMPCNDEGKKVTALPIHNGSHPTYNTRVLNYVTISIEQLKENKIYDANNLESVMNDAESHFRSKIQSNNAAKINEI